MTIVTFMSKMNGLGIKLWLENGQLKFKAPKGIWTDEIRDELIANKEEVIALLQQMSEKKQAPPVIAIRRVNSDGQAIGEFPLSFSQERMWFIDQLEPDSASYNISHAVTIRSEDDKGVASHALDIDQIEQAFNLIISRHENLRTIFPSKNGKAQQLILENSTLKLERVDLSHVEPEEMRCQKARQLCQIEARTPFDLSEGPLLRVKTFKLSPQEQILLLNMHHIISDGWSMGVMIREFTLIVDALRQGKKPNLPPLPIQYLDYSVWQREWLGGQFVDEESKAGEAITGNIIQQQLAYWKRKLSGVPESLNLATDYPRPNVQSFSGGRHIFSLGTQLTKQLNILAKRQECTLFMLLLTAFKVLLYRYSNQEDICIGTPVANRHYGGTESLIGLFINTLALRSQVKGENAFSSLLSTVKKTCLEGFEHQDTPFEKIVDLVQPQRNRAISPLFQVMFVLQNMPKESMGGAIETYPFERASSKFDIIFEFKETPDGLDGSIEYGTALFKSQTIERMGQHFVSLCNAIVSTPSAKISDLEFIDEVEKQQLLIDYNDTQADYPHDKCIHQLFIEQAAIYPDKIAVVSEGEALSYQQLYDKSHALALYLQSLGVQPDSLVGLCVERSVEMMVGILGILQAGGAYIPLDPEYPDDRLAYMLKDSKVKIVLSQEKFKNKLHALVAQDTQLITLDQQWSVISDCAADLKTKKVKLQQEVKPHHLAYVIYTSGSTGQPKGVMVEHKNLVNHMQWIANRFELNEKKVILQKTSLNFDAAQWEIMVLVYGTKVVMGAPAIEKDPEKLINVIIQQNITTLQCVPTLLKLLLEHNTFHECENLVDIFCGGESLDKNVVDECRQALPNSNLYNIYGPTECTIDATAYDCLQLDGSVVPIGTPIDNTQIYILDYHNNPVPMGIAGELHVAGEGVARGYLNRPELTNEKFIPNPFNPGARMYKSGDLARWLGDGNIEYLGRIDTQVKIRGFRIELGEIEARLNQYPGIKGSVVIALGQEGNKKLIAYYVAVDTREDHIINLDNEDIRADLQEILPEYMTPAAFVSLEAIPLTPNGKVDRRALERMDVSLKSSQAYLAPRNATEKQLVAIWAEVLDLESEEIGVNDNFFELGGHSLLATQLISRIRGQFTVDLPLKALFEQASVAGFAPLIVTAERSKVPIILPISRTDGDGCPIESFPLSFAQERLWFIDQLEPDSAGYNIPGAVTISGGLDADPIEQAFNLMVARHENLRTIFPNQEGQAQQVILDSLDFKLDRIDFSHYKSNKTRHQKTKQLCQVEAKTPFDLAKGPLIRGKLIKLTEQEHILMLTMHHIVSDGWSMGVMIREFGLIMDCLRLGKIPDLSPLPIQYLDYSIWQRQWLEEGGVREQQLAYWQEKLADVPESLNLATDYPRPRVQSFAGARQAVRLDSGLTSQLKSLAEQQGCTLFMTLLAAFKVLLYRYTGQEDICLGSPIANRQHEETESLIGMFVNTLALRSRVESKASFTSFLAQVKTTCLEAYENQDTPFEKIVDLVQPGRNMAINPLFQIMFSLQSASKESIGQHIQSYPLDNDLSKFDLTTGFVETAEGLEGEIEYSTALFNPQTIERMAQHFVALCQDIVSTPKAKISGLEFIDEAEKQQLLVDYNNTQADYQHDKCIHQLFTEQVDINPDKIAVAYEDEALSYQQLYDKSHAVALYLQSLGVKPDSLVGLCVDRSLDMMVGILGILQAGGGYVPLDPEYPDDRLAYMLQDSQVSIVLSQEKLKDKLSDLVAQDTQIIALDQQWSVISDCAADLEVKQVRLQQEVKPHHLAYVIYTSGSTGKPKGVAIEHHSSVALVCWAEGVYSREELSGVLASTSISFDLSVYEIFLTLSNGGKIILVPNVLGITDLSNKESVTLINTVPSAIEELIRLNALPDSVQTINLAGEPLSPTLVDKIYANSSVQKVYDLYGPSEDTTYSTFILRKKNAPQTIGRPIANTQIYILDQYNNPVPIGVPGELHIAGGGLARGYLNRPELTEEKFIPNPFNPGTRLYKSGDLARWLGDGNIECLGRIDTQVKIRGFRIELGEIEAQLNQNSKIKDSVVIAQEKEGNKQLLAYYVAQGTKKEQIINLANEDIRVGLQQTLPEYMLPAAFISLESIPLTPNGKVDRRALERMDVSLESSQAYLSPRNVTEKQLVSIWAKVLNLKPEKIGVNDNFFELGGHSLLATQLISRIRSQFTVDLPLKALFEHASVASFAALVAKAERSKVPLILPVSRTGEDSRPIESFPLSFAQQRLWFIDQLEPDNAGYNILGAVTISGELEFGQMEQAFNLMIARHENLRTIFPSEGGQAQQVILESLDFKLERIDLSPNPSSETRHENAKKFCQNEAATPFDLTKGPLIRGKLIKLTEQEHILMLTLHHIISDGWSMGVTIKEFGVIMDCLRQGRNPDKSPDLPPLPIQYLDYSIWQRKLLQEGGLLQKQLTYWQEKLGGVPESLNLATDYPRPSVQSFAGARQAVRLDSVLTSQLKRLAEQQGCTLFMTLMAAFKVLLYRYTGQEDICLGSPIANRQYEETESLIGMFVNTLALRNQVQGEVPFILFLDQVKTTCLEAYEHQDTPFEKIVDLVQPERNMSVSPLFQIMFVLQNALEESTEEYIQSYPLDADISKFDLTIGFAESPEGLEGEIEYSTALFNPQTIERMAKHFVTLCQAIISTPNAKISELEYIGEVEKQQLLTDFNDTKTDYPKDKCIHQLFIERVVINPDKIAVVYQDESLSYQQLYEKSHQLALYLQSLGVKPDSLVGLCVERSLEMVVGMLGILQAGGAYVPLDPDYPDDRLAYMLQDSQTTIVLSQEKLKSKLSGLVPQGTQLITLDQQWSMISDCAADLKSKKVKLQQEVKSHHLAYVIYTSGSTGQPKGVVVEHRSLHALCVWHKNQFNVTSSTNATQVSNIGFDASVWEIWPYLTNSACVTVVENGIYLDISQLNTFIKDNKITHCFLASPVAQELLQIDDLTHPYLQYLLIGGDRLSNYEDRNYAFSIINNYGPTESTVVATSAEIDGNFTVQTIGRPISNTRTYILDQYNNPVPIGIPGELHISGDGLARGYLNQPDLTEEKFIANPFDPLSRMYKSGDLARWLGDGSIEYLGRIDTQVKIRGYRIELGEIETRLNYHPKIKDAIVIAQEQGGNKQLIAYYTSHGTEQESVVNLAAEDFRAYLQQTLPEYMVPAAFVSLEAIPLTPNGKVDRRALERMDVSLESSQAYLAPRNATEKQLVVIWAEILNIEPEKIGVNDNFFELGGDSIKTIQIVSKAIEQHIHFDIRDMFKYQNIQELLQYCDTTKARVIRKEEGTLQGAVDLSPIQSYFFKSTQSDIHHFNQSVLLNLNVHLSIETLQDLIIPLLEQHDALRLRYAKDGDDWHQRYLGFVANTPDTLGIHSYDIAALGEKEIPDYIEQTCNHWQAQLDLEEGPIIRWVYFDSQGNGCDQLAIIVHHLVIDGVSWRILLEDLNHLIGQQLAQQKLHLSQKRSSYRNWVDSLATYKKSIRGQKDFDFWVDQSKKTQHANHAFVAKAYRKRDIQNTRVSLSKPNTEKLLKGCHQAYGTDINDLLLTAVMLSYYQATGNKKLILDLEGHGREQIDPSIDITKTVGWFTSIYPVSFELSNPEDIHQCIKEVKTALHEIPNRGIGLSIFRYIGQHEAIKNIPEAQVVFNFLGDFQSNEAESVSDHFSLSEGSTGVAISQQNEVNRLITINGLMVFDQLFFTFSYPEEWQGQKVSYWQTYFISALERLIEHCYSSSRLGFTPSDFSLLPASLPQLDKITLDLKEQQSVKLDNIQDIYPLTPLQSGILFETLYAQTAANKGMYLTQSAFGINGQVDINVMRQAWQLVLNHYDALRMFVVPADSAGLDIDLQVILKHVNVQINGVNWSEKTHPELKSACEQWMRESKSSGIDLDKAPLMRVSVFQGQESCYMLFEQHHIVMDGWSQSIVLGSLFKTYQALAEQQNYQLPRSAPHKAYVQAFLNRDQEEEISYWKKYFAHYEERTPLPMERLSATRDVVKEVFDTSDFYLSKEDSLKLEQLIKKHRLTMNTALQFIWGLLLHLHSGNNTIIFGSVSSGRTGIFNVKHGDQTVGLCINTTPTSIRFDADLSLMDHLKLMQNRESEKLSYEVTPLIRIQELLGVKTNEEFFQTLFVYENYPVEKISESNSIIKDFIGNEAPNYPLSIAGLSQETLAISFTYDGYYYDEETITTLMEQFERLTLQLISAPEIAVKNVSLISAQEEQQLLTDFNNTQADYPSEKCIHQLFIEQVAIHPDKTAVVYQEESLSYQQLCDKSHELALYLQSLGVKPDSLVGLCVERSVDMMVGILGILQAGGAYVPLDPGYPDERLTYILENSQVSIVLSQEKFNQRFGVLAAKNTQLVTLDQQWSEIHNCVEQLKSNKVILRHDVNPDHLAYVIYTSGSTGKPKGVMVEHRALMNRIFWMQQQYSLHTDDIVLQKTPFSFDVSVWEFVWPMMSGASVVFAKPEGHKDAQYLEDLINEEKVTTLHFVPSMFNVYLNHAKSSCSSIRQIFCSGEALDSKSVNNYRIKFPQASLFNLYGPTEAAIDVTAYDCSQLESSLVPIGAPIANTQIYILDNENKPVPIGVPGELHIAGDGLARGYLNRPELTEEKFIPNPFNLGTRMYKSGDLCRWLVDGNIEYLGRMDTQVKIRGFRIELGEIEVQLNQYLEIKDSIVIAQEQKGDKQLVAYYVARDTLQEQIVNLANEDLTVHLQRTLPEYMLPAAFVSLETIPLTPNGKVDRRALERMDVSIESSQAYLAPRNEMENQLVAIWAEVLKLDPEKIGVNDNFFELGGHSLLATQVVSKIRSQLEIDVPMKALFDAKTVAGISEVTQAIKVQHEKPSLDVDLTDVEFEETSL